MSPPSAAQAGNDVPTTNTEPTRNIFVLLESVWPLGIELVLNTNMTIRVDQVRRGCPSPKPERADRSLLVLPPLFSSTCDFPFRSIFLLLTFCRSGGNMYKPDSGRLCHGRYHSAHTTCFLEPPWSRAAKSARACLCKF